MSKNELPVPILALGLGAAFVFVSAMVALTGNPRWIQRKLRIGALLLGLTAVVNCGEETRICYEPVVRNQILLETSIIDISETQIVSGSIQQREAEEFSYRLEDGAGEEMARDDILAADGAFDEATEEFAINLPVALDPGFYDLLIYAAPSTAQDQPHSSFTLEIQ